MHITRKSQTEEAGEGGAEGTGRGREVDAGNQGGGEAVEGAGGGGGGETDVGKGEVGGGETHRTVACSNIVWVREGGRVEASSAGGVTA